MSESQGRQRKAESTLQKTEEANDLQASQPRRHLIGWLRAPLLYLPPRGFQELSPLFYGPFKVVNKIGKVAYKLELPAGSLIHPTFHVSKLRRSVPDAARVSTTLPSFCDPQVREPIAILARRMVKRGRRAATQVLVLWRGAVPEDAIWEFLYELEKQYPTCPLEDKCLSRGET
ncbi:hypothetical protein MLD38_006007 [Melastoma candidum]|uniref:Uncharacterized protein n=1 Tax=Melastoma candidum TaxID=119954 RepID=A0ACB9RL85_9MYRT|nr:hypothetical protein MLD38_006007 [Melastoma candidum]